MYILQCTNTGKLNRTWPRVVKIILFKYADILMSGKFLSKTVFILMSYMEWATEMGEKGQVFRHLRMRLSASCRKRQKDLRSKVKIGCPNRNS